MKTEEVFIGQTIAFLIFITAAQAFFDVSKVSMKGRRAYFYFVQYLANHCKHNVIIKWSLTKDTTTTIALIKTNVKIDWFLAVVWLCHSQCELTSSFTFHVFAVQNARAQSPKHQIAVVAKRQKVSHMTIYNLCAFLNTTVFKFHWGVLKKLIIIVILCLWDFCSTKAAQTELQNQITTPAQWHKVKLHVNLESQSDSECK